MMVNCVGDQATYHRPLDAPLTADTEGKLRARRLRLGAHRDIGGRARRRRYAAVAVQAGAHLARYQIATLILPSDTCWDADGVVGSLRCRRRRHPTLRAHVGNRRGGARRCAAAKNAFCCSRQRRAARPGPLADAHRIVAATGAGLLAAGPTTHLARGRGRHPINRVPYPVDQSVAAFAGVKHVILAGAVKPMIFFAYPNKPGTPIPDDATVHVLTRPEHDQAAALAALADELGAPAVPPPAYRQLAAATARAAQDLQRGIRAQSV